MLRKLKLSMFVIQVSKIYKYCKQNIRHIGACWKGEIRHASLFEIYKRKIKKNVKFKYVHLIFNTTLEHVRKCESIPNI